MAECINCKFYSKHFCRAILVDVKVPENDITCKWFNSLTNAENIRMKTDKELSDYLSTLASCAACPIKNQCDYNISHCNNKSCEENWYDYLTQPRGRKEQTNGPETYTM